MASESCAWIASGTTRKSESRPSRTCAGVGPVRLELTERGWACHAERAQGSVACGHRRVGPRRPVARTHLLLDRLRNRDVRRLGVPVLLAHVFEIHRARLAHVRRQPVRREQVKHSDGGAGRALKILKLRLGCAGRHAYERQWAACGWLALDAQAGACSAARRSAAGAANGARAPPFLRALASGLTVCARQLDKVAWSAIGDDTARQLRVRKKKTLCG